MSQVRETNPNSPQKKQTQVRRDARRPIARSSPCTANGVNASMMR